MGGVGLRLSKRISFVFMEDLCLDAREDAALILGFPSLGTNTTMTIFSGSM